MQQLGAAVWVRSICLVVAAPAVVFALAACGGDVQEATTSTTGEVDVLAAMQSALEANPPAATDETQTGQAACHWVAPSLASCVMPIARGSGIYDAYYLVVPTENGFMGQVDGLETPATDCVNPPTPERVKSCMTIATEHGEPL